MAGVQRDYLAEGEVELGLALAPLTSSYLLSRSMTHFMYLIVKHQDLLEVTGQWGIPWETGRFSCPPWPGVRFTLPAQQANIFLGRGECWSLDEEVHISDRYGQLMAHLIKKRAIKIGRANG